MPPSHSAEPDQAHALVVDLHTGLAGLHDSPLQWERSREFNRAWEARQRSERQFCVDFLARLDSGEVRESYTPQQIQIARAEVRMRLAGVRDADHDPAASERYLLDALQDARAAGHAGPSFAVHMRLGTLYREGGCAAAAEWHYKEALAAAGRLDVSAHAIPQPLYWLGVLFSASEERLREAVFSFDLASRFGASEYRSLVEMQQCRLRLGEREAVLAEAEASADAELPELARAAAALQALGRRRKRLGEMAARGLQAATETNHHSWKWVFERILGRNSSPLP